MSNNMSFTVVMTNDYMYDTINTISDKKFGGNVSACLRYMLGKVLGPEEEWKERYGPIQRIKSASSQTETR